MTNSGRIYTVLKIDEVNNLGAARIRIRSLIAAVKIRNRKHIEPHPVPANITKVEFTKEMKKDYTIPEGGLRAAPPGRLCAGQRGCDHRGTAAQTAPVYRRHLIVF